MSENHLYSKDRHRAGMRKLSYSMTCTTRPAHLSPPGDCFEQLHRLRLFEEGPDRLAQDCCRASQHTVDNYSALWFLTGQNS